MRDISSGRHRVSVFQFPTLDQQGAHERLEEAGSLCCWPEWEFDAQDVVAIDGRCPSLMESS